MVKWRPQNLQMNSFLALIGPRPRRLSVGCSAINLVLLLSALHGCVAATARWAKSNLGAFFGGADDDPKDVCWREDCADVEPLSTRRRRVLLGCGTVSEAFGDAVMAPGGTCQAARPCDHAAVLIAPRGKKGTWSAPLGRLRVPAAPQASALGRWIGLGWCKVVSWFWLVGVKGGVGGPEGLAFFSSEIDIKKKKEDMNTLVYYTKKSL